MLNRIIFAANRFSRCLDGLPKKLTQENSKQENSTQENSTQESSTQENSTQKTQHILSI